MAIACKSCWLGTGWWGSEDKQQCWQDQQQALALAVFMSRSAAHVLLCRHRRQLVYPDYKARARWSPLAGPSAVLPWDQTGYKFLLCIGPGPEGAVG